MNATAPSKTKRTRRRMTPILIIIAVIGGLWIFGGCAVQRTFMYPRYLMAEAKPDAEARPAGVERWTIEHDDGITEAWFIVGEGVSDTAPGPAVIYSHGNAELIDDHTQWISAYTDLGVSVLLVEYRGYGRSDGSPSQPGITEDFAAAYDQLIARADVDGSRIVFHGRSIGGGVACSLANERTPAALILQSTFSSAKAMAAKFLFPPFLLADKYENDKTLATFDGPVLLLHGNRDTLIPIKHSRKLDTIAANSQLVDFDSNHNDLPLMSEKFRESLRAFLTENELIAPR
jgi:fermentation-respiration switch protein FrsA (DUF1100 family)